MKIAIYGVIAYLVYRWIGKKQDELNYDIWDSDITGNVEIPSYSEGTYFAMAEKLNDAMAYAGTDEDSIKDVFKEIKKLVDYEKVKKKFGIKTYYDFECLLGCDADLDTWLRYELDSDELEECVNRPLRNNGIDYQI